MYIVGAAIATAAAKAKPSTEAPTGLMSPDGALSERFVDKRVALIEAV